MYRVPTFLNTLEDAHEKWLAIFKSAENTVKADHEAQLKSKADKYIPGRDLPVEVVGKFYASYCTLINQMYDAYLNSVHLQRSPYILSIVNVFVKRMYELRDELIHLIVHDYFYVDTALKELFITPFDIQIVVPYHFVRDARPQSMEAALQKMWTEAFRRKYAPPPPTPKQVSSSYKMSSHRSMHEEGESDAPTPEPSIHSIPRFEFIYTMIIQRQERYRQWYLVDFRQKCKIRRMYFAVQVFESTPEMKHRAAKLIQRVYREVMSIRRKKIRDKKRDILLGMLPEHPYGKLNLAEENRKMYEKRLQKKLKVTQSYLKDMERVNTRLLYFKWDGQIEDITEQIREWFREWYFGYGFFPQYPYEVEGGSILVITGQYPTVEEQVEADEKAAEANKGKSPEQKKQEAARLKDEAKRKALEEKDKAKKEAFQMFKLKCNPLEDPGYKVKISPDMNNILQILTDYRAGWSLFDCNAKGDAIYGYLKPILVEDVMSKMHKDCRIFVDQLMRLDLKLLITAQKKLYKSINKPFPRVPPRKKPKAPPVPKPFEFTAELQMKLEPLFDKEIISKPTTKFSDVFGDLNYTNYEYSIRDPDPMFPPPAYGDVKNRLMLSCVFGCGVQPGADRNKAVMLLGPPRSGKSFLADAVAGELNAVKIDITPEVFSAGESATTKLLNLVFTAARAYQPTVIFLKDIERVFRKKVLPEEKYLNAGSMKSVLSKLVKKIIPTDKIIFLATCSDPQSAKAKPMVSMFDEIILVPRVDYGTLYNFFFEHLQRQTSIPTNFPINPLAQIFRGYGIGVVIQAYRQVMNPARICSANVNPLRPDEFVAAAIEIGEPMTNEEFKVYEDFYLSCSPLKGDKAQYQLINERRAEFYEKMRQKEAKKKK